MASIRASSAELREPVDGWSWVATAPDAAKNPAELPDDADWLPAPVPGTVATTLAALPRQTFPTGDPDRQDHWYRTRLRTALQGRLRFDGLATLCEIWVDGVLHAESRSMFLPLDVAVDAPAGSEIALCFRSLEARLTAAPRRARWRPAMIVPNGLRWFRTTAFGSMPGWCPPGRPTGPWRPIWRIAPVGPVAIEDVQVQSRYAAGAASLSVAVRLRAGTPVPSQASLRCGSVAASLVPDGAGLLRATLAVPDAEPWFPHTHGEPRLYGVQLHIGDAELDLGRVGFRSITVDRGPDQQGFGLVINDVPVFCRGACWSSPDVTALPCGRADYEPWLLAARDAGMNTIRVGGTTVYEAEAFFDLCDELGLMVWQDMMLANFDYPQADATFRDIVRAEAETFLHRTQTAPSLVVLCGGSEVFQQAAMLGAPPEAWSGPVFDQILPQAVETFRPDLVYVPNSPSGGPLPFVADQGVTHYYGVGAYMRGLDDARRAQVRFASECLAFANLPDEVSLGAAGLPAVTHHPDWKRGVPRDLGASWDFEDVRDHYVERLYGVNPAALRRADPEHYLALSRAAVAAVMEETFAEWRRPCSPTRGALIWMLQDLQPGAGWGVLASDGEPKSAWHALARAFRPTQLSITDEGTNGLALHVINERPARLHAKLVLTCWRDGAIAVINAERDIELAGREALSLSAFALIGSFFDITYAYRFGPPGHDVTSAQLIDHGSGRLLAEAFHFPLGRGSQRHLLGLRAEVDRTAEGWFLLVSTTRFAQSVHIVDESCRPAENWFHLRPGITKRIAMRPRTDGAVPDGEVRAVNATDRAAYVAPKTP